MDKPLRKCTLFLPVNKNTRSHLADLLDIISEGFSGCTYSRYHYPPKFEIGEEILGYFIGRFTGYPNEYVMYITFDVEMAIHPDAYENITALVNSIKSLGEKKVWLIYHDVMLDN